MSVELFVEDKLPAACPFYWPATSAWQPHGLSAAPHTCQPLLDGGLRTYPSTWQQILNFFFLGWVGRCKIGFYKVWRIPPHKDKTTTRAARGTLKQITHLFCHKLVGGIIFIMTMFMTPVVIQTIKDCLVIISNILRYIRWFWKNWGYLNWQLTYHRQSNLPLC